MVKKKVELIRIVLEHPDFIILDEPTNFLDPEGRMMMFECLTYLNRLGSTILISSHILQELKYYIDSATIIDNGQVMFTGDVNGDDLIKIYESIVHRNYSTNNEFYNSNEGYNNE